MLAAQVAPALRVAQLVSKSNSSKIRQRIDQEMELAARSKKAYYSHPIQNPGFFLLRETNARWAEIFIM
jgi:hypothetical protein